MRTILVAICYTFIMYAVDIEYRLKIVFVVWFGT
jgi:hypothetical protein